jgi:hypothetical protein
MIVAPAFISASLYQLLAHIVIASGEGGGGIGAGRSNMMVKMGLGFGFGALDLLGYALQAAGEFGI